MLNKDLKLKVFNSAEETGMAVLRACIDDVGEFDAGQARPLSTTCLPAGRLKKRIFIWKENIITERSTP